MLYANYHTHTTRCNHASGSEREYIEQAISAGLIELGFSDHSPMVFHKEGYYSGFRMKPWQLEDYVKTQLIAFFKGDRDLSAEEYQKFLDELYNIYDFQTYMDIATKQLVDQGLANE